MSDQNNNAAGLLRQAWQEVRGKFKGILWGAALCTGAGIIFLTMPPGEGLVAASYDLLFQVRDTMASYDESPHGVAMVLFHSLIQRVGADSKLPDQAVVVYLDDSSHERLHQKYLEPWNRGYYTRLLKRLTADGAKAVVFDIIFSDALDPATDQQFADAIRENGTVILACDWTVLEYGKMGKAAGRGFTKPLYLFDSSAQDLGITTLFPEAGEYVRKYNLTSTNDSGQRLGSEAWATALLVKPSFNESNSLKQSFFWINYYAPETSMPSVSFYKAIADNDPDVRPGFFSNKVVFVGEKLQTYGSAERKDEYSTPFSHRDENRWYSGVGIHATAFLNLIRGDYLRRFSSERIWTVVFGVLFGTIMVLCPPLTATLIAMLSVLPIALWDYYLFQWRHTWFACLIPIVVQIPIALVWGIAYNSLKLYAEKVRVEQSLSLYLSPKLVKKFTKDPTLLKPGAVKHLLTILFTDIADFTSISEGMDPDELARLMNEYFQTAVHNCIHATDGTVVKYIGDAIFAFWNAPELQGDHAFMACDAALRFRALKALVVNGRILVTRLGLHTGVANVGNFGSDTRVDYTAIGENINLASRMEGLNKYLGTRVLVTADTQREIGSRLVTRYLGLFRLKGFERAVGVYELVGQPEQEAESRELRERFATALEKFAKRDFAGAGKSFRHTLEASPEDGPAQFYLEQIEELGAAAPPADWKGEIILKDK